jgi:hypothetical protein
LYRYIVCARAGTAAMAAASRPKHRKAFALRNDEDIEEGRQVKR